MVFKEAVAKETPVPPLESFQIKGRSRVVSATRAPPSASDAGEETRARVAENGSSTGFAGEDVQNTET
jgi:hypothetical protein